MRAIFAEEKEKYTVRVKTINLHIINYPKPATTKEKLFSRAKPNKSIFHNPPPPTNLRKHNIHNSKYLKSATNFFQSPRKTQKKKKDPLSKGDLCVSDAKVR